MTNWRRTGLAFVLLCALGGAGIWAHDAAFEAASDICRRFETTPSLRERARLLDRAEPYRRYLRLVDDDSVFCQNAEWEMELVLNGNPRTGSSRKSPTLDLATRRLGEVPAPRVSFLGVALSVQPAHVADRYGTGLDVLVPRADADATRDAIIEDFERAGWPRRGQSMTFGAPSDHDTAAIGVTVSEMSSDDDVRFRLSAF